MTDPIDRALQLNDAAKNYAVEYHSRIAKGALTAISAVAAILAFLVNAHHISYIQHPWPMEYLLYAIFVLYGIVYVLELISIRTDATYTSTMGNLQMFSHDGAPKEVVNRIEKEEADPMRKKMNRIQRAAEWCAALGTVALASFSAVLLFNIVHAA